MTASWYANPVARSWSAPATSPDARAFHEGLPGYSPTPLVHLPALAAELGVARVLVKDETARLGLPAFKVLGASWACSQALAERPGARLVTATEGNHGRAVARMAREFGVAATIFVPATMTPETEARIAGEGAEVRRVDGDYDEAVEAAAAQVAASPDALLIQDTAFEGYERVPAWIVEGYQTMLAEIDDQLAIQGLRADLVAVPVGVGSFAEAVTRWYRQPTRTHRPSVLSVEPDTAACLLTSLRAGRPESVVTTGSAMAGLNCGTVSESAWPVLSAGCDQAVAVRDDEALRAMTDLTALGIAAGPSGAAPLAGVRALHRVEPIAPDTVVVLLCTEGRPDDA